MNYETKKTAYLDTPHFLLKMGKVSSKNYFVRLNVRHERKLAERRIRPGKPCLFLVHIIYSNMFFSFINLFLYDKILLLKIKEMFHFGLNFPCTVPEILEYVPFVHQSFVPVFPKLVPI